MPNRSRKQRLPNPNTTAVGVTQAINGEPAPAPPADGKDPAAVAQGLKEGKARAAKMTAKQRSEAAKKVARARWGEREPGGRDPRGDQFPRPPREVFEDLRVDADRLIAEGRMPTVEEFLDALVAEARLHGANLDAPDHAGEEDGADD